MRKFLLEKMTRPVLYIPTVAKTDKGKRLYAPFDGISVMMFIGFCISIILNFVIDKWWSIPFVSTMFLYICISVYFKLYPRKWHEMNDEEKVGHVRFNGSNSLTEEQYNEYLDALNRIHSKN